MFLDPTCFESEWIRGKRDELRLNDAGRLEVAILAFELLGRLVTAGLEFVFKGGTSVLLHVPSLRRLSVDIDIVTERPFPEVLDLVQRLATGPFRFVEHQTLRDRENPPTRHIRIGCASAVQQDRTTQVQLDVLCDRHVYPRVEARPVVAPFVLPATTASVMTPVAECLLAEKLTAFAPGTIGVQYEVVPRGGGLPPEPQPLRVAKQLYDVGVLFDLVRNPQLLKDGYRASFGKQTVYRGQGHTIEQALNDTRDAAFWPSQDSLRRSVANARTEFFARGFDMLNHFLTASERFSIPAARPFCARAAYLSAFIQKDRPAAEFLDYRQLPDDLRGVAISGPLAVLNGLRGIAPEAFWMWKRTADWLGAGA
jgi:hypothetical protein